LLFLVILITIIAVVTMIIVRLFSSRRVMMIIKIVTGTVSFLAGVSIALFFVWEGLGNIQDILNYLAKSRVPMANWYPHIWVGKFLSSFLPGVEINPIRWGLLLLVGSVGLPVIATFISTRIYYRSWELSRSIEVTPRKKTKTKVASFKSFTRGRMRAIIMKDFWTFIRNSKQIMMTVMLSAIILLTIFAYIGKIDENSTAGSPEVLAPITPQIILYSIIISFTVTWGAFKNEGDVWWLLQSAPISPSALYKPKLIFGMILSSLYTGFWMVVSLLLLRMPANLISISILFIAGIITAVLVSINVAVGSLPWMAEVGQWKQSKNPTARIVTYILSMILNIFLLIIPIIFLGAVWDGKDLPLLNSLPENAAKFSAIGIILLFFLGIFIASYMIGKRNLSKLLSPS